MTSTSGKPPKKEKSKGPSAEARAEGLRYIRMMYGPTAGERSLVSRKINLGTAYLDHPKFQSLMTAFKKGASFNFSVKDKERTHVISTDGTQILFDGRTVFYSRPSNRHEEHLLLDRTTAIQFQTTEPFIHLAVAVLRSLPELGPVKLTYLNQRLYLGSEPLESAAADQGSNLLIGSFVHSKSQDRVRK